MNTPNRRISLETVLVLVLCAGFLFTAFYGISFFLAPDEVASLRKARMSLGELVAYLPYDGHVPLYYMLLHPILDLIGNAQLMLRLVSVFFYFLSAGALCLLCKELWRDRTATLWALALFLVSNSLQDVAHFGKMYTLVLFLGIVAGTLFIKLLKERRVLLLLPWTLLCVTGTFIHPLFLYYVPAHFLAYVVLEKDNRLRLAFAAACLVSLAPYCLIWLPISLVQVKNGSLDWIHPTTAKTVFLTVGRIFGWPGSLGIMALLLVVGIGRWKNKTLGKWAPEMLGDRLFLSLALPVLATFGAMLAVTFFVKPTMGPARYLVLIAFPLAACAVMAIRSHAARKPLTLLVMAMIVASMASLALEREHRAVRLTGTDAVPTVRAAIIHEPNPMLAVLVFQDHAPVQ